MVTARLQVVSAMGEDERELVESARAGDEEAFAALARRYTGGLHRTVARMLGDEEEAWDVVQMALLRAWQKLDRYDPRWRFSTWLYRIGTNLAIDVARARSSRERAHEAGGLRVVASQETPAHRLEAGEIERVLRRLALDLSPQQRAAFILREVEGLDTGEVARVMGCSAATVRNHVFHARKVLRRELLRRYPELVPARQEADDAV